MGIGAIRPVTFGGHAYNFKSVPRLPGRQVSKPRSTYSHVLPPRSQIFGKVGGSGGRAAPDGRKLTVEDKNFQRVGWLCCFQAVHYTLVIAFLPAGRFSVRDKVHIFYSSVSSVLHPFNCCVVIEDGSDGIGWFLLGFMISAHEQFGDQAHQYRLESQDGGGNTHQE